MRSDECDVSVFSFPTLSSNPSIKTRIKNACIDPKKFLNRDEQLINKNRHSLFFLFLITIWPYFGHFNSDFKWIFVCLFILISIFFFLFQFSSVHTLLFLVQITFFFSDRKSKIRCAANGLLIRFFFCFSIASLQSNNKVPM